MTRTMWRGITYRERKDGVRVYYVHAHGKNHRVDGDLADALTKQSQLRLTETLRKMQEPVRLKSPERRYPFGTPPPAE